MDLEQWIDLIKALCGLWKPILALVVPLALLGGIFFPKRMKNLLCNIPGFHFKKGSMEISAEQHQGEMLKEKSESIASIMPPEMPSEIKLEELPRLTPDVDKDVLVKNSLEQAEHTQITKDVWKQKLKIAYSQKNRVDMKIAYENIQNIEQDEWYSAYYLFLMFRLNDDSALQKLYELTTKPEVKYYAWHLIGVCNKFIQNFKEAANAFKNSADGQSTDTEARIEDIVQCADCFQNFGNKKTAIKLILDELKNTIKPLLRASLFEGLAKLYEFEGKNDLRAFALEKALELKPNDLGILFDVAYLYSKVMLDELAFNHYVKLLHFEPDHPTALNNVGVEFAYFKMPIKAFKAYKKSYELGETLSAANLAKKYIEGGFIDDAESILNKVSTIDNCHADVNQVLASLPGKLEEESKVEKKILEESQIHQKFIQKFTTAYFTVLENPPTVSGHWMIDEKIDVNINIDNGVINFVWNENNNTYTACGELQNYGALLTITMKYSSFMPFPDENIKGLMFFSNDSNRVSLMIIKNNKRFIKIKRKNEV